MLARIRPFVLRTPLIPSPVLSERSGRDVRLKLESLQTTGSFKLRGAAAKLTSLPEAERRKGVVACSSGNHGRAVAHMSALLGMDALISVPRWVDPVKLRAMREAGARVVLSADSYDEAEAQALKIAREEGRAFIPPFDDPQVMAGQGTLGVEILEQCPDVGEVALALSGGGLAGGVALALKTGPGARRPPPAVTAVSAQAARVMWESLRAGAPVELPEEETLAGALAGGIGLDNRFTFPTIRDQIDSHVLVDEREIANAIRCGYNDLRSVLEGGGAVALAALLAGKLPGSRRDPLVVVLSGGNLDPAVLAALLAAG